jgi:hypothetical protein
VVKCVYQRVPSPAVVVCSTRPVGFIDAGYSRDWTRIGAISEETEAGLRALAVTLGEMHIVVRRACAHARVATVLLLRLRPSCVTPPEAARKLLVPRESMKARLWRRGSG